MTYSFASRMAHVRRLFSTQTVYVFSFVEGWQERYTSDLRSCTSELRVLTDGPRFGVDGSSLFESLMAARATHSFVVLIGTLAFISTPSEPIQEIVSVSSTGDTLSLNLRTMTWSRSASLSGDNSIIPLEHYYCDSCRISYLSQGDGICANCERCSGCCDCSRCSNCGTRLAQGEEFNCGHCSDCCSCLKQIRVRRRGELEFRDDTRLGKKKAGLSRLVSCELEVAGVAESARQPDRDTIMETVRSWGGEIVADGSLPVSGFEINTAPASGSLFLQQIREVTDALSNADAYITTSCGLHVHVDARDLAYSDLRRLAILWAKVEPGLLSMVPPSRRSNHYCCVARNEFMRFPGRDLKFFVNWLQNNAGQENRATAKSIAKNAKYDSPHRRFALNLYSWLVRGTVENRLGAGTTNYSKIINWTKLTAALVDFAAKGTDKLVESLPDTGAELDSLRLLLQIVPTEQHAWIKKRHLAMKNRTAAGSVILSGIEPIVYMPELP